MKPGIILSAVALILSQYSQLQGQSFFKEDFESGSLSQWTGKSGGEHHGIIVTDPLNTNNKVLTFTTLASGGDIYGPAISTNVLRNGRLILSFDFLGFTPDSPPLEYGGFIGIDVEPGEYSWLAGTYLPALSPPPAPQVLLTADGSWHHYNVDFTDALTITNITSFQLVLEDWSDRGGNPGDVFFDNIEIVSGVRLDIRVSQVEICWETVVNKSYQLEYKSALTGGTWITTGAPVLGTGGRSCATDAVPVGEPQRYYRATVLSQ